VLENVEFGLRMKGVPPAVRRRQALDMLDKVGLADFTTRKPRELSGGQRQRVAVGRAIVREPKVFLFDEPLSNLDAKLRVQTRAEISKLHQRLQTTFIYVTHDQTEAMTMATRIAVMNKGVLQQLDTPQNLYDRPGNLFVAGFIGSPAMNFFPAKICKEDSSLFVESPGFKVKIPDHRAPVYQPYVDREIIFGIRPENIINPAFAPPGIAAAPVEAKVDVTELMGNEILLYLVIGNTQFVARVDPRTRFQMGDTVQVVFNMENFHIFDAALDKENPPAVR
jgi:multiple sugar transport system ATP-binding protein